MSLFPLPWSHYVRLLCAEQDAAVAHYTLDGLPNKILAARYKTVLPEETLIAAELGKTRKLLESWRLPNEHD